MKFITQKFAQHKAFELPRQALSLPSHQQVIKKPDFVSILNLILSGQYRNMFYMIITRRQPFLSLVFTLVLGLFASGFASDPAMARKEDSEPGVSDNFGRANRQVRSSNIHVRAVNAALLKQYDTAFSAARQSKSSLTRKIVEWIYLRREPKKAGYTRLMAFVYANPSWPRIKSLKSYAERRLLWGEAGPQTLAAHFKRNKPSSSAGHAALARLELSRGNKKAAKKALLKAWYNPKLGKQTKAVILRQLRGLLSRANHERRLWILIHDQQTNEAINTAGLVSSGHVKAAQAAQSLIRRKKNALGRYKRLPAKFRQKLAIKYALARFYRKKGKPLSALNILSSVSAKTSGVYDQAAWWVERRLIVRELADRANRKQWPRLYQQATRHGFSRGKHFEEGEFLAGWIALRKLGKAKTAVKHFTKMAAKAKSRTQKSRGDYWAARAYLVLGNKAKADRHFRRAAQTPTLFYAQLAREALGKSRQPIHLVSTKHDAATKAQIAKLELVRAVNLLHRSGGSREVGSFIWPIAKAVKSKKQASAAASLMHDNGGAHLALRLAKAVGVYGYDIDNWGYPLRAMPKIKRIGKPVETAVIFGISRQESEFNATARSYVGARGLMQLMPGTAKMVAKKYKLSHSTGKLTSQPAYNAMLGTALLGDLIHQFNGSYILTFVGYNAGPGRSRQWVKKYGDPRGGRTDPIDWIESIPYTETRKYVQKVMQNVHIYRSRLTPKAMTGMSHDLARGTVPVVSASGVKKANPKCGGRKTILALIQDC